MSPVQKKSALDRSIAHHPDEPAYDQDVYRISGRRLCIGCFTTIPVFLLTVSVFLYATMPGAPVTWLLLGAAFALAQGVSSAGWARRRWMKATVKTCLGLGLGLLVVGVLSSEWAHWVQVVVLLSLILLAGVSTIPRSIRMRRAAQLPA